MKKSFMFILLTAATVLPLAAEAATFRVEGYATIGGAQPRRKLRLGPSKTNVTVARKIAVIYYNMLKYGEEYFDYGCEYYEQKYKEKKIKNLHKRAKEYGFELVATAQF